MPITIKSADQQINISGLKDLESDALTAFNLGMEFGPNLTRQLSDVPDKTTASLGYDSGSQKWNINAVGFNLCGGVTGKIAVIKSGKLYDYTDSFPAEVELGLSTREDSKSSTPFPVDGNAIYVAVELDFSIEAGVCVTTAATTFGLSGTASASTSDNVTVAFYKKCSPGDILCDAIARAFKDLVLPFHSGTIDHLRPGDVLRHTASANLQLGMGAGIGFSGFSLAHQWKSGIPGMATSPTLSAGLSPSVTPTVNLAYSFSYAGTFEQTLWRASDSSARLHLYKSTKKTQGLEFTAGITANANASAEVAVQQQIQNAPAQATSDPHLRRALNAAFTAASGETSKLAGEINAKICKLLEPVNNDLTIVNLDVKIASTNQAFLLTDYTIDLTKNYAAAWDDMVNGRFVDALADAEGSVQLATGSGLEKLYSRTASIGLNFFGQWVAQWSEASIANSRLIYAGNNTFHLITAEGIERIAKLSASSTEVDFYFSVEMDLSGSGTSAHAKPDLHAILKASSNVAFGKRIATMIGWLSPGPASQGLVNQILQSLNVPASTQVLHVVIPHDAYQSLACSQAGSANDGADRHNYDAFASACKTTMPAGTTAQFIYNNREFDYGFWRVWNIAVTDQYPPGDGAQPNRKGSGSFQGSGAAQFLHAQCGAEAPVFSIGVTLQAASEFMDLCEDLKLLGGDDPVDINTWNDFADRLLKIANRDVNLDYIVPTVLALTQLCGSGKPALTVGPAPELSTDTSIGVTMTFAR